MTTSDPSRPSESKEADVPATSSEIDVVEPLDDPDNTAVRRQSIFRRTPDTPDSAAASAETDPAASPVPASASSPPGPASSGPPDDEQYFTRPLQARWTTPVTEQDEATNPVFEGAVQIRPHSRTAAHWWTLAIGLILSPLGWYLVTDGGARLTQSATGTLDFAALGEIGAGYLLVIIVFLTARWSALGVYVTGALATAGGLAFLIAPGEISRVLRPAIDWLEQLNAFGSNVAMHLQDDGYSGRLALYGLALVLLGVVATGARRGGRAEQRSRTAYERHTNSAGHVAPSSPTRRHSRRESSRRRED